MTFDPRADEFGEYVVAHHKSRFYEKRKLPPRPLAPLSERAAPVIAILRAYRDWVRWDGSPIPQTPRHPGRNPRSV